MSADSRRQLQRVFGLLDRDHDNFLILSELNRFMAALQLEPGTLEDFRAFCEQTGASPELGLSVGDFTAAYAETPTEKLDEIILLHGREWAAATSDQLGTARVHKLPRLTPSNSTSIWAFDPSIIYGFDEAVLLLLIFACLLVSTAAGTKARRVWRRCTSEDARLRKDADTLGLIGTTARQIALDLDTLGGSDFWTSGSTGRNYSDLSDSSSAFGAAYSSSSSSIGGGIGASMNDLSAQLGDLDILMAGLTSRPQGDDDLNESSESTAPKAE